MTRSAERAKADSRPLVGSAIWRAEVERDQERVLPAGRVVVSCSAPLGAGGLGRHLQEVVDALDRTGQPTVCICGSDRAPSVRHGYRRVYARAVSAALAVPPLRLAAARRELAYSREFDSYAAGRLPAAEHLIAFNGTALEQIQAVRRGAAHRSRWYRPPPTSPMSRVNMRAPIVSTRSRARGRGAW